MPKVSFNLSDDSVTELEGDDGDSLRYVATENDVFEIEAKCGAFCDCANHHVYTDEAWYVGLRVMSENADELLDGTIAERLSQSLLSCQITQAAALDGLVVTATDR